MRVLVSQKVAGIAGSEKYLLTLLPALNKAGLRADFLLLYAQGKEDATKKFETLLKAENVTVYKAGISSVPRISELRNIYRVIMQGSYDLLHSNLIDADVVFATIKLLFNRRLVLVSGKHGYEESYNNAYGFDPSKRKINFYWACARFAELFINRSYAISEGLYRLYTGLSICRKSKIEIIPYGFDFDDSFQYQECFRFGDPQLVVVGRLTEFKGHRYAILALEKLVKRYPSIKLVIVGWGPLEDQLKKMVAELQLQEHVVFTGFQPRPRDIMYTSDIVLLPSVSEGFGIVVLEALSVKRPVVAFNVPSPSEIFQNRKTGLLAQPYSVDEYAALISELIEKPELRKNLAEAAYTRLKEYYNLDRMINETLGMYERALNGE